MNVENLYDHYKDTNDKQKDCISKRDRYTVYLLLCFVTFAFLMYNPETLTTVVNAYIKDEFSVVDDVIDFKILDTGLIYILLWLILQYYQVCLTIERNYEYINELENMLSNEGYKVSREGKSYANDYPLLKNLANFIYAWGMPIGVFTLSVTRIFAEYKDCGCDGWPSYIGFGLISLMSMSYFSDRNLQWSYLCFKKHKKVNLFNRLKGFVKIDVKE